MNLLPVGLDCSEKNEDANLGSSPPKTKIAEMHKKLKLVFEKQVENSNSHLELTQPIKISEEIRLREKKLFKGGLSNGGVVKPNTKIVENKIKEPESEDKIEIKQKLNNLLEKQFQRKGSLSNNGFVFPDPNTSKNVVIDPKIGENIQIKSIQAQLSPLPIQKSPRVVDSPRKRSDSAELNMERLETVICQLIDKDLLPYSQKLHPKDETGKVDIQKCFSEKNETVSKKVNKFLEKCLKNKELKHVPSAIEIKTMWEKLPLKIYSVSDLNFLKLLFLPYFEKDQLYVIDKDQDKPLDVLRKALFSCIKDSLQQRALHNKNVKDLMDQCGYHFLFTNSSMYNFLLEFINDKMRDQETAKLLKMIDQYVNTSQSDRKKYIVEIYTYIQEMANLGGGVKDEIEKKFEINNQDFPDDFFQLVVDELRFSIISNYLRAPPVQSNDFFKSKEFWLACLQENYPLFEK